MTADGNIKQVLDAARRGLEQAYGARMRALYLYGSWARGTAADWSDLDLLVVLDRVDSYFSEIERTSELRSALSLEHDLIVSTVFVSEADWRDADTPFFAGVREEACAA